jgi:hypothetical protein
MKLYEQLAADIEAQIRNGVYRFGGQALRLSEVVNGLRLA